MDNFYGRAVFFVKDAELALKFYTEALGFKVDWTHKHEDRILWVFQVSLHGVELILNQIWDDTKDRAGHGRLFVGLEADQTIALREHIAKHGIKTTEDNWGKPTIVIKDLDGNELFFWPDDSQLAAANAD